MEQIVNVEIVLSSKQNLWDDKQRVVLIQKTYKNRAAYVCQLKAIQRLAAFLQKKHFDKKVSLLLFFPSFVNALRSIAAKKAVLTKKRNEVKKIEQKNNLSLFPEYLNETDQKLKKLKDALK